MAERVYGTTVIPGDEITVIGGGTIAVSTAFARTVGFVGGMDTAGGTATPGEVETLTSQSDAADLFGENSELYEQVGLALQNGVREIFAVGVPENSDTEAVATSDSTTLANAPLFDPNVHYDHDIVVTDTSAAEELEVLIVYDTPVPGDLSDGQAAVNPLTGEVAFYTSGDYDVEYTYGDYSASITAMAEAGPRIMVLLSEDTGLINDMGTELSTQAQEFNFSHGIAGIPPETDADTFTSTIDDPRLSLVGASRGYIDSNETVQARSTGAVGGKIAGLALGSSSTYDSLAGLTGLVTSYTATQAGALIDEGVMPVMRDGRIFIVKDMTTSTDVRFERVYSNEIVDEATELSHLISQQYIGELNTDENLEDLEESHRTAYLEMREDRPPLLDDFAVTVSVNDADPNAVDIDIGLDVVNVIDTINVTIVVGDVITNGGAE